MMVDKDKVSAANKLLQQYALDLDKLHELVDLGYQSTQELNAIFSRLLFMAEDTKKQLEIIRSIGLTVREQIIISFSINEADYASRNILPEFRIDQRSLLLKIAIKHLKRATLRDY